MIGPLYRGACLTESPLSLTTLLFALFWQCSFTAFVNAPGAYSPTGGTHFPSSDTVAKLSLPSGFCQKAAAARHCAWCHFGLFFLALCLFTFLGCCAHMSFTRMVLGCGTTYTFALFSYGPPRRAGSNCTCTIAQSITCSSILWWAVVQQATGEQSMARLLSGFL